MKNFNQTIAATSFLIAAIASPYQASANANNLRCNNPFVKVATYNSAIKCKKFRKDFSSKSQAEARVRRWKNRAGCNAHSNPPTGKVWFKLGKWAARVTFTCAIIY